VGAKYVGIVSGLGAVGTATGMSAAVAWPTSNIAGYVVAGKILGGGASTTALVAGVGGPLPALLIGAVLVGTSAVTGVKCGRLLEKIMFTKK